MTFGESLKRFRLSFGLKQKEIADALHMKPPLYQRYESGITTPSVDFIYKIVNRYDVTADYLLGLSDEPRPKSQEVRDKDFFERVKASTNLLQDALKKAESR